MAVLVSFNEAGEWQDTWVCDSLIGRNLAARRMAWGRWPVPALELDAKEGLHAARLAALHHHTHDLRHEGWTAASADVLGPAPRHDAQTERETLIAQTVYFAEGVALLYLRVETGYLALLAEAGEWVTMPAGVRHWFDGGEEAPWHGVHVLAPSAGAQTAASFPGDLTRPALPSFDAFVEQMLALSGDEVEQD